MSISSDRFSVVSWFETRLETTEEYGQLLSPVLVKGLVGARIRNPFAGEFVEDLSEAVEWSPLLGHEMGRRAVKLLDGDVRSYGKGAMVGTAGEQEHGVMFITTPFGDALRQEVGGGLAWIPSTSGVTNGERGFDVPLAHKDELTVRDHYDSIVAHLPSPLHPDEVCILVAAANRGRPNARLGGTPPPEAA